MTDWLIFETAAAAHTALKTVEAVSFGLFDAAGTYPVTERGVETLDGRGVTTKWADVEKLADGRFGFPHPNKASYWQDEFDALIFTATFPPHEVVASPERQTGGE